MKAGDEDSQQVTTATVKYVRDRRRTLSADTLAASTTSQRTAANVKSIWSSVINDVRCASRQPNKPELVVLLFMADGTDGRTHGRTAAAAADCTHSMASV